MWIKPGRSSKTFLVWDAKKNLPGLVWEGSLVLRRQHNFLHLGDVALRVDEVQKIKAIAVGLLLAEG
jgi:hypothetical protein